ncbi:MAG TPA: Rieske 2Fe-2S domain-containing protein [Candidatus Binatia bacterium]
MTMTANERAGFVFSKEENDALTKVGPGSLLGQLFRQYWIPVLPTSFLEEKDGNPRSVRLLGEDLVLFRSGAGEVGLIGAFCSHRLAPLFFGRIEENGLRCPYHGWKYAPGGQCLEMPNVPPEQEFKSDIHHTGYPCVEKGGIVWTFMGRSKELPPLPDFEFLAVPEDQRAYRLFHQDCNYLQALEGGIDPTHVMWLHSPYNLGDEEIAREHQGPHQQIANKSGARTPLATEIVNTPAGFMYGTKRPAGEGKSLWRVNQFLMPFYTMPPGSDLRAARAWVPIDDENSIKWMIQWFPTRALKDSSKEKVRYREEEAYAPPTPEPYGFIRPKAQRSNNYLINWEIHRTRRMGVPGVNLQDRCVTENEGPSPILDRTQENLCSGDMTTIKARRILLSTAKALREQGTVPPGAKDSSIYRVRAVSKIIPDSIPWVDGIKEDVTVAPQAA